MKKIILILMCAMFGMGFVRAQYVDMSKVMTLTIDKDSLYADLLIYVNEGYGNYAKIKCGTWDTIMELINLEDTNAYDEDYTTLYYRCCVKCPLVDSILYIYGEIEGLECRVKCHDYNVKCGLDVSGNSRLTSLVCSYSNLETLILGEQPLLTYLNCEDNFHLSKLDASGCPELQYLNCSINPLTELNVSKCLKLERLLCGACDLKSLDVSRLTELTELDCLGNELQQLDVSNCTKLEFLICWSNKLMELDVSNNMKLERLFCEENCLKKLDVSGHRKLHKLRCFDNELEELNVSKCRNLWELLCMRNKLRELDVSGNKNLWHFGYEDNMIDHVDWVNEEEAEKMEYVR